MFYFAVRYHELTTEVTVLQAKLAEKEKVRVIRTTETKEKEKPVDDEPPLEYSQVLYPWWIILLCLQVFPFPIKYHLAQRFPNRGPYSSLACPR